MTVSYSATGLLQTSNPNSVATLTPVNTQTNPGPQGLNALRLLASIRGVSLAVTGDVAVMPVINSASWSPVTVVTSNGQVSGVAGSIATASLGVFTAAASGGSVIKTQAALASNSAAGSSIAIAAGAAAAALAFTGQSIYVNVGTALANATCDVFIYGYDQT
jgi:hypothetical protein